MIDRQFFGDLVLAVALVLPTAALAKSQDSIAQPAAHAAAVSPAMAKAALADRTMSDRGVGLFG